MSSPEVAVLDYGLGNLLSVSRALEHCGASVKVTADHQTILAASHVVLPGVGAFAHGMAELRRHGLDDVVREVALKTTPLFGICLGMQMLLDESEEFGQSTGLGVIRGRVIPVPAETSQGEPQKIPHIGWNGLTPAQGLESWGQTLLHDVSQVEAVYFVHSFMADPADPKHRIADCIYGGKRVAAAIGRDNIFACQFHPEKSGNTGLKILRTFVSS